MAHMAVAVAAWYHLLDQGMAVAVARPLLNLAVAAGGAALAAEAAGGASSNTGGAAWAAAEVVQVAQLAAAWQLRFRYQIGSRY